MNRTLFENKNFIFIFSSMLLLTIFFTLGETGAEMPIYSFLTPYKITLLVTGILFLIALGKTPKETFYYCIESIKKGTKPLSFTMVMIVLYILYDLISLSYTNNIHISLLKYVTIVSMLAVVFFGLLLLNSSSFKHTLDWTLTFISGSSLVLLVYAWTYEVIFDSTIYARRLSLLIDYNKFSMALFFGFISTLYLITRKVKNVDKRNIFSFIATVLYFSTIHLTASRRTSRMMNVVILVLGLVFLVSIYVNAKRNKSYDNRNFLMSVMKFILGGIISYLLIVLVISGYSYLTTERILSATKGQTGEGVSVDKGTEEVLDDLKTLDKREVIWTLALRSYREYPTLNKIIGKGASAHFDIYNEKKNHEIINKKYWKEVPENTLDPHNFALVDLLDGGIIKVTITLLMLVSIPIYLFKIRKKHFYDSLFIFLLAVTVLGDMSISSRYGILDNKMVWLILLLLLELNEESTYQYQN